MTQSNFDLETVRMRTIARCQAEATAALSGAHAQALESMAQETLETLRDLHLNSMRTVECATALAGLCAIEVSDIGIPSVVRVPLLDALSV